VNDLSTLSFGRWLKRLRAQHDLTQEALAELAYCSVQTIRFFESGKRRPSVEMAERLAQVLRVPADQQSAFVRLARTSLNAGDDTSDASNLGTQVTAAPALETPLAATPSRLPMPATLLVGRQPEAAQLQQLLVDEGHRLVTLVGPGGIGKTRLALHMAHTLEPHFAQGALFVPLVSISHSVELPTAIAGAMNKSLAGDSSSTAQLDALLADQSLLLVLDNFEHLLALDGDGTIGLIDHIVQHIPGVHMLITSRERLRLAGERIFELGGLEIPKSDPNHDAATSDAVILFLQRARQVAPAFALTPSNRAAIIRLCILLSGMPLGIELAAAWMRTLTPEEIATEIARSLDFLTLADRGVPARHRSLRAAFEHSWKLLAPEEQRAAAHLSIFRGGFRREGAQAVAGATLPHLAALIDKSLVQVVADSPDQEMPQEVKRATKPESGLRYEIHELLRQYLRNKLVEMGDEEGVARRHITYFTTVAEKVESHHHASVPPAWFRQLRAEQGNLRAAMEWSLGEGHAPELGLRLVGALGRFWYMTDAWKEGRDWLGSALAMANATTPPAVRARVLTQLGDIEHAMAEYPVAQLHLEEALAIWRALDDQQNIAWTIFQIGVLHSTLGNFPQAEALLEESLALYRRLHEPWFVGMVLMQLAGVAMSYDNFGRAIPFLDEALPLLRAQDRSNMMAVALNFQGWALLQQGDCQTALEHFQEALTIGQIDGNFQSTGWSLRNLGLGNLLLHNLADADHHLRACLRLYVQISFKSGIVIALELLASVAAEQGNAPEAVQWLAVAEQLRHEIGLPRTANEERLYYNRGYQMVKDAFSQLEWEAAWTAASRLSFDDVMVTLLAGTS
jgi:predicted ATPase/transcriptional regulator with XRE-family HTH domain